MGYDDWPVTVKKGLSPFLFFIFWQLVEQVGRLGSLIFVGDS